MFTWYSCYDELIGLNESRARVFYSGNYLVVHADGGSALSIYNKEGETA